MFTIIAISIVTAAMGIIAVVAEVLRKPVVLDLTKLDGRK